MASSEGLPSGDTASKILSTKSAHGLFVLPNELLSMIAQECEPADLANLRLVCKILHEYSTEPFACKYFSRRRFLFTYESMKALVDITAHPTFAPHLTCITFGTYRLLQNFPEAPRPNVSREWLARYRAVEAMHRHFVERKQHIEMLVLALENLKRYQNTGVSLGIYDDYHRGDFRRRGYAFGASYQDLDVLEPDPSTALDAVLTAWRQSDYPLAALKLFLSDASESLEELVHRSNSVLNSGLPHVKSRATKALDIHVNVWRAEGTYSKLKFSSKSTCLDTSRHLLGRRQGEESSLLRFCDSNYGYLWQAMMSCPLQTITIERSDVLNSGLVRFLRSHQTHLKSLDLHQIRVASSGYSNPWVLEFLRFLRDSLALTHLSMCDLSVIDVEDWEIILPVLGGELVCDGQEEVDEGLERLIEEVKQEYHFDERLDGSYGSFDEESEDD